MPIPYTKTRFYIDQNICDEYIKDYLNADLEINIVPKKATKPHPKGRYTIPFLDAIAFIRSKKYVNGIDGEITYNWRNNNNWHSATIPRELIKYFEAEGNISEEGNIKAINHNHLQIAQDDVGYISKIMEMLESEKKEFDELKIGKLVKNTMSIILEKDLISENEIQNLLKKDYSKFTFNVIFPILKKVDKKISLKENGLKNGYPRYYVKPIENRKTEYLLTNEWKEYNREKFMNWLKRKVSGL